MKQIIYLITSNGADGIDNESIHYASFDEISRDYAFESDKNKNYLSKVERIIDHPNQLKQSLSKLNPIDKLILEIK